MLNSEKDAEILFGCGVDEEIIERFNPLVISRENPMPLIFSEEEFEFVKGLSLSKRAVSYAASFCCKESLFKACGFPFNFNETSFFYDEEKNICTSSWSSDIFLDEGWVIKNIEHKISIWNNRCCTAQLCLTARRKEK